MRVIRIVAALGAVFLLRVGGIQAQEMGAFVSVVGSDNEELPSPSGYTLFAGFPLDEHWQVLLSLHSVTDRHEELGWVCAVASPPRSCVWETVSTKASLRGFRGGLERQQPLGPVRVGAAAGLSFNQLSVRAVGTSGRREAIHVPSSGQLGAFATLSASVQPLPGLPLRVVTRVSEHRVAFNGCAAAGTGLYDPFCKPAWFHEAEVGLTFTYVR